MNGISGWLFLIFILPLGLAGSYEDKETDLKWSLLELRRFVNCQDREYKSDKRITHDFWVLENYLKADHGPLSCYANVTYTTHADYRYLENVVPLLERWRSPLSLAIYAPGEDFDPTLRSILYLLQCHPGRHLVRELTSFHLYFNVLMMPKVVPTAKAAMSWTVDCEAPPPYANVRREDLYRSRKNIHYPVNMGRNIARQASLTHFVLASDIELYPSPGLVPAYLRFFSRSVIGKPDLMPTSPVVHVLRIFEINSTVSMPNTKPQLQQLLKSQEAVPFHLEICRRCHKGPQLEEWINATDSESEDLNVFNVGYRSSPYEMWEPIFIGTTEDPAYDERLSWEGQRDKMTQAYAMCVLNYEFHILNNAFLVHKPGIRRASKTVEDNDNDRTRRFTSDIIRKISRELRYVYGSRKGCII